MPTHHHLPLALLLGLLASGCVSAPSGKHWWSPATWGSSTPAKKVTKLEVTEHYTEQVALLDSRRETEKTARLLNSVPGSPATRMAKRTSNNAIKLMAQVLGPLSFSESRDLDLWSVRVVSSDPKKNTQSLETQEKDEKKISEDSDELREVREKLKTAEDKLALAFDKENELADTLRNERAIRVWIIGGGSVLVLVLGAGWLYLQIATGGIPKAIGGMLKGLDETDPEKANLVRSLLDPVTNRIEQALIRKHT